MQGEPQLDEIARAAGASAGPHEEVAAVLAAEPHGVLVYLCALRPAEAEGPLAWIAFDRDGTPVDEADTVRAAATLAALCETAEEAALAPDAAELAELADGVLALAADQPVLAAAAADLRDAARAIAAEAEARTVARATYVDALAERAAALTAAFDRLRACAEGLSAALDGTPGESGEPLARACWRVISRVAASGRPDRFADALTGASGAIDALAEDVLTNYRGELFTTDDEETM